LPAVNYIVNATPLGNLNHQDKTPIPEEILFDFARNGLMSVMDMNYIPAETIFMRNAKKYKVLAQNGVQMAALSQVRLYRFALSIQKINLDTGYDELLVKTMMDGIK